MNAVASKLKAQAVSGLLGTLSPVWAQLSGNTLSDTVSSRRATARLLAVGIARAAEEGRVKAWKGGHRNRCVGHEEQPDGSYLTCCPSHDDHNPSLVLSDRIDETGKPKLLVYCRSGCSQHELVQSLDELGLWNCTPELIAQLSAAAGEFLAEPTKKETKKKYATIVPVPVAAPGAPCDHPQLGPTKVRYEYRNADGELVLYVCRFEPNPIWTLNYARATNGHVEKPDHRTFRPLSFCEFEDRSTRWHWVTPTGGIPLYGADQLAADPTAKVIVCEGEKAVSAARRLFPGRVAITWLGGAKAVHKAPLAALARRDVLVWPDHDNAGAKAAEAVVNELRLIDCASIAVLDVAALCAVDPLTPDGPKRQAPEKWDAADAVVEWCDNLSRLAVEVDRATRQLEARVRVEMSPDNIGETVDKAEEVLRRSHLPIFQRAGFIVRAGQYIEKTADERTQLVLSAHALSPAGLGETLERVIRFEQQDGRRSGKGTKPVHAPELLLKTLLERGKFSGLKPLTGVTDIPLIRRNGSLLDVPGYDKSTGILLQPVSSRSRHPRKPYSR